jgi:hypothetical protein
MPDPTSGGREGLPVCRKAIPRLETLWAWCFCHNMTSLRPFWCGIHRFPPWLLGINEIAAGEFGEIKVARI